MVFQFANGGVCPLRDNPSHDDCYLTIKIVYSSDLDRYETKVIMVAEDRTEGTKTGALRDPRNSLELDHVSPNRRI